jgi:hypothetical protein
LSQVLAALLPSARELGVSVSVISTGPFDAAGRRLLDADGVQIVEMPADASLADRRREAILRSGTDITMLVDEARALQEVWSEVLAIRCGFVRHPDGLRAPVDWRTALQTPGATGVPDGR